MLMDTQHMLCIHSSHPLSLYMTYVYTAVLYCIVLYCIPFHCIALHCIVSDMNPNPNLT